MGFAIAPAMAQRPDAAAIQPTITTSQGLSATTPSAVLAAPINGLVVGPAAVIRPQFLFDPRIGVSQSFTDNAGGAPPFLRRMDTYTTVEPGALLDFTSAHHRFIADYTLTKRWYYDNEDLNRLQHSLNTFSQSELVDGLFFVDTQVALQDGTLNELGSVSADPTVQLNNNSTTVLTASASPFFRYSLENLANFETRYRYGRSTSLGGGTQDSETHQFTQNIASGTEFQTFIWGATFDHGKTDLSGQAAIGPTGDRTNQNYLGVFSAEVPITREFSLAASAGYERIEDATLDDQPDGPIWSVGFRYRPGPRTTLQLAYGDRYDRRRVSGGFSYLISQRSTIEFSYGTNVRSTSPTAANSVAFLAPDGFGNLVDVRTGQGLSFSDSIFGLTSASFIADRFESRLTLGHDNATSTIAAYRESRTGSNSQADQTSYGATYGYTRSLSTYLRMGFNIGAAFTKTDGNPEREDLTITGGGSLDYSFSDTLTGTLGYRYFDRDSNSSGNNLRENLITAGIRKAF